MATLKRVADLATELGLLDEELIPYGRYKGKIVLAALSRLQHRPLGRYVLVTAINPTPLGEGKTVTSIGLAMGLCRLERRAIVTLRQPSLGPVFGIKGGASGGGRAQVVPQDEINLHLTGDAHAVAAAHNLLAAFVDNHLAHDNALGVDPDRVTWPRVMGLSDRGLRDVTLQSGRQTQFVITEASEVMAILALAADLKDLRRRLGRILVGMTKDGQPVLAEELRCAGAMTALLKDAMNPNLLQTTEGTPAILHTGPFGNIAHGNCSIVADALALRLADYVVTEAGFGSDLGAEKFFNIKCRVSGLRPAAAVIVVSLRALKLHGGGGAAKPGKPLPSTLTGPNREALIRGFANLEKHIANVRAFGVPVVVAVNAFRDDPTDELEYVKATVLESGAIGAAISTPWTDGSAGAEALANAVVQACEQPSTYMPLYENSASIEKKISTIARRIYGAEGVTFEPDAKAQVEAAERLGYGRFPICMAKTQYSLSHDPLRLGRPTGFTIPIRELRIFAGAEFLTAVCGGMQLMPGLPSRPVGEHVDVDPETGQIVGLS
ncbi:MAG TPA: formate--tetrahydrofolate ligase [Nitrospirales bacterium]|nr:formate--tetrahydrofolate ligase [Nitrospirales bacterium]